MTSLPRNGRFRDGRAHYTIDHNGCWLWQGSLNSDGYPTMRFANRTLYAHRVYYEALVGPIPEGLQLDHACSCRRCVFWGHLQPVTQRENIRRGNSTKLTVKDVSCIRDSVSGGVKHRILAARFGVHSSTISRAATGVTWGDA